MTCATNRSEPAYLSALSIVDRQVFYGSEIRSQKCALCRKVDAAEKLHRPLQFFLQNTDFVMQQPAAQAIAVPVISRRISPLLTPSNSSA